MQSLQGALLTCPVQHPPPLPLFWLCVQAVCCMRWWCWGSQHSSSLQICSGCQACRAHPLRGCKLSLRPVSATLQPTGLTPWGWCRRCESWRQS